VDNCLPLWNDGRKYSIKIARASGRLPKNILPPPRSPEHSRCSTTQNQKCPKCPEWCPLCTGQGRLAIRLPPSPRQQSRHTRPKSGHRLQADRGNL